MDWQEIANLLKSRGALVCPACETATLLPPAMHYRLIGLTDDGILDIAVRANEAGEPGLHVGGLDVVGRICVQCGFVAIHSPKVLEEGQEIVDKVLREEGGRVEDTGIEGA